MLFGAGIKSKQALAIHCGTSAVHAVLFSYEGAGPHVKPEVSQIIHVPFEPMDVVTADVLRKQTAGALDRIWNEIPASSNLADVCIGLSSPFYVSQTSRIARDRSALRKPITRQELNTFLEEAAEQFKQEIVQTLPDCDISEILVFNKLLLKTFLNGYRVQELLGKSGNTLEMFLRFEATTSSLYHTMTHAGAALFPRSTIRFVSLPVAYFYILAALFDTDQGFLLVDIDGEVSDISLVTNGVLERVFTVPVGSNLFEREVAELLRLPLSDAAFLVRRYAEQTLEENRMQQIAPIVVSFQKVWQARFLHALERYAKDQEIPPRILFTGSGVLPLYKESVTEDFLRSLSLTKRVSVSVLSPSLVDADFKRHQFSGPSDMALACLVLLCARGVL